MGMGFAPTLLRQVSPLFHKTTLTTAQYRRVTDGRTDYCTTATTALCRASRW